MNWTGNLTLPVTELTGRLTTSSLGPSMENITWGQVRVSTSHLTARTEEPGEVSSSRDQEESGIWRGEEWREIMIVQLTSGQVSPSERRLSRTVNTNPEDCIMLTLVSDAHLNSPYFL